MLHQGGLSRAACSSLVFLSQVGDGGGEVTVPSGLRHHGAGSVLWPALSTLKTLCTYSEQVRQDRLCPLENETF